MNKIANLKNNETPIKNNVVAEITEEMRYRNGKKNLTIWSNSLVSRDTEAIPEDIEVSVNFTEGFPRVVLYRN